MTWPGYLSAPAPGVVQGAGSNVPVVDPGLTRFGHTTAAALPQAGFELGNVPEVWGAIAPPPEPVPQPQPARWVLPVILAGALLMLGRGRRG